MSSTKAPDLRQIQQNILDRLKEVQSHMEPLVAERDTLAAVAAFLDEGSTQTKKPGRRAPTPTAPFEHAARAALTAYAQETASTKPGSKPRVRAKRRRSRQSSRSGGARLGKRAAQALVVIYGDPGVTVAKLAEHMGIKKNYLYRLLPGMEKKGLVRRRGKGWATTPTGSQLVVARSGGMKI